MKFWYFYVGLFYCVWLVLVAGFGYWEAALSHWPIGVTMVLGSVVAGSTPMGGGTVAFPVLVLLFGQSADIGRNFGMAIQALGMTSALIFILCRRTPVQPQMLVSCAVGAALGLVLGTFAIAPLLPGNVVKLLFSCLWMSFGILTLAKNREVCALDRIPSLNGFADLLVGLLVGILGGVVSSIIGIGIEMLVYTVLVLRYRCDLKAAVPTSVGIGGITSLMGIGLHALIGDIGQEIFYNWLAAAPIVVFGAPLGTYLVSVIPRFRTLYFVSFLCVLQFVWTLAQVAPNRVEWLFVAVSLIVANAGFYWLYQRGKQAAG